MECRFRLAPLYCLDCCERRMMHNEHGVDS